MTCWDSHHNVYAAIGGAGILLYAVGIPLRYKTPFTAAVKERQAFFL